LLRAGESDTFHIPSWKIHSPVLRNKTQMQLFGKTPFRWPPAWTHRVDGVLWQLKLSTTGHLLAEVRHPERKTTRYTCLDARSGAARWQDLAFDEPWWIGVEEVLADRVYFHRYRKPDLPQHIGIIAVDLRTGATLWENREYTFVLALGDEVVATRQGFDALRSTVLDAATGEVVRELGTDIAALHALRAEHDAQDAFAGYAWPVAFDPTHPDWEALSPAVAPHVPLQNIRGALDVLPCGELLLASWHESTGANGLLDQHFLAIDARSGAVAYRDRLAAGVASPTIDSFFVKDDLVLYVKDTDTLTVHILPSSAATP
jgi:hypothetical protein